MASPAARPRNARAGEESYRKSIRDAVMLHLGTTPAKAAYCEAALGSLWEYGELSPYDMAVSAWNSGNRELYESALADDDRLTELAEEAKSEG